ncbi:hypothetical protein GCM10022402_33710 [Salinactinospora qingdaonensis]|uniref:Uncharacterized protein n=1 Tax=Salinactinospora qingdaonensis TaxID=702744 RepID=A0ABP7G503_9ACTN
MWCGHVAARQGEGRTGAVERGGSESCGRVSALAARPAHAARVAGDGIAVRSLGAVAARGGTCVDGVVVDAGDGGSARVAAYGGLLPHPTVAPVRSPWFRLFTCVVLTNPRRAHRLCYAGRMWPEWVSLALGQSQELRIMAISAMMYADFVHGRRSTDTVT